MPSDYGHEFADKELKKLESKLTKEYKQAAAEVEKKMKDFLSKFEEKDKKMLAKVQSGEMSAQEYAEWRKGQIMTGKRWEDMRDTLAQDLVNADKIAAGMINDSLPNAYAENMNFGTYEVESGVNIDTGFTLYDRRTVENLMKKDPQIIPQARIDIPKDELWNRKKLTSAVTQGILQGESIPKIAKRLRSVADMDRNAAIRNARTYTTAAENKGRVDSYERANNMGIPVKQMWMATLDERTRMEHRHLDGQVRAVGEYFETDGYRILFPGDPRAEGEMIYNCRCTLVADLPKYGKDLERNESKLGDMTYEEWKHAKDKDAGEPKEESAAVANTPIESAEENIHIQFGKAMDVLNEYRIANSEDYASRMDSKDIEKFNNIFKKAEYIESDNGSHYDPQTNKISIAKDEEGATTIFHESTHWFDFNQDYTIVNEYKKQQWVVDENGDITGERKWVDVSEVMQEHASFSEYIAWKWDTDKYDYDNRTWIDSDAKKDMRNFVNIIGTSDTYGNDRSPEDVKHDMDAIKDYIHSKGIQMSDTDYEHLSDFISAISFDANLGSLVSGGHSYEYWVYGGTKNRITEITAGYNLLKATGREDMLDVERELAPNLMKLIEEEWSKIW